MYNIADINYIWSTKMNDNIPLPLYYKVKEDIKKKIEENTYVVGSSLPTEKELIDIYHVSRTTIRQAADLLVHEGYLERKRGVGTFITLPKVSIFELEELKSFSDEVIRQGHKPSTKVISMKRIIAPQKIQDIFFKTQKEFFQLERLRYVDDKPSLYVITYIPCEFAQNLDKENLEKKSLFDVLFLKYGIELAYAEKVLKAINISKQEALLLNIKENSAIQQVETITYDTNSNPVEYSLSKDRGDRIEFCILLFIQL